MLNINIIGIVVVIGILIRIVSISSIIVIIIHTNNIRHHGPFCVGNCTVRGGKAAARAAALAHSALENAP